METASGIEFFHSSDIMGLEKEINDFLNKNSGKIVVKKRNVFLRERKGSLHYEILKTANTEQVKFFTYNNASYEHESQAEETIKKFVIQKNVLDILFDIYLPTNPFSENTPLMPRPFRRISEHNLVAVFYQE